MNYSYFTNEKYSLLSIHAIRVLDRGHFIEVDEFISAGFTALIRTSSKPISLNEFVEKQKVDWTSNFGELSKESFDRQKSIVLEKLNSTINN